MVVCPVCEHQQAFGFECEVCGKDLEDLGGLGPPPVALVPVEGLEVTVPERVGDVSVERLGELEQTSLESKALAVSVEPVAELETGKAAEVGDVPIEPMVELSLDRAPDDGVRTVLPEGAIVCRYCRNVQATGALCNTCGMKLPTVVRDQAPVAVTVRAERSIRCRACGAPATPGARCSECGAMQPAPT